MGGRSAPHLPPQPPVRRVAALICRARSAGTAAGWTAAAALSGKGNCSSRTGTNKSRSSRRRHSSNSIAGAAEGIRVSEWGCGRGCRGIRHRSGRWDKGAAAGWWWWVDRGAGRGGDRGTGSGRVFWSAGLLGRSLQRNGNVAAPACVRSLFKALCPYHGLPSALACPCPPSALASPCQPLPALATE